MRPNVLLDTLRCPQCGAALTTAAGSWNCAAGHRGRLDQHGIVHLTDEDFYYREVPRPFFDGILKTRKRDDAEAAFRSALAALDATTRDNLIRYALDPNRGGAALLGATGPGTVALDFGSGWGNLTNAIRHLGGACVSVDMTYESLLYGRLTGSGSGDALHVRAGRHHPLPFADAAFDTVFLNGVLEWIPEGYLLDRDPRDVHLAFLREFRRLLKPGGRIVVGIENRTSLYYFLGRPEDHTGLRFNALLPRRAADWNSRRKRGRPYRTYTYTYRGYQRLLRDAGFDAVEISVPWPRYRRWNALLRGRALGTHSIAPRGPSDNTRLRIAKTAVRALQPLGLLRRFAPDFYIVGPRTPAASTPDALESIAAHHGERGQAIDVIHASTTHTLHFHTDASFYKVPLTPIAEARLRADIASTQRLRTGPLAALLVAEAEFVEGPSAPPHARYTRIDDAAIPVGDARRFHGALAVLQRLAAHDEEHPLGSTETWHRLNGLLERSLPDWLESDALRADLRSLEDVAIASGPVHGDLTPSNVLLAADGPRVIDWDRHESLAPRFLDALHLQVSQRAHTQALHDQLRDLGSLSPHDRAIAHAVERLGAPAAARLYLYDRIEKDLSAYPHPIHIPPEWHTRMRRALAAL